MSQLPNNLKSLRNQKGYTQSKVAEKLDIPLKRYQAWEEGRSEPHSEMLLAIARLYDITVDELLKPENNIN